MSRSPYLSLIGGLLAALISAPACGPSGEEDRDVPVVGGDTSDGGLECSEAASRLSDAGGCACGDHVCRRETTCEAETSLCVTDAEADCSSGTAWSSGTDAFEDVSEDWNLPDIDPTGVRISATDFDGDGWPDLAIRKVGNNANSFADDGDRTVWLLRNTGDGSFEDVTEESNLLESREDKSEGVGRPAEVVVWGDVDNDGDLDAYTGFSREFFASSDDDTPEIMLNDGEGNFELGPRENDIRQRSSEDQPAGATFVDYNRDGNLDLWVTEYTLQDRLYRGDGEGGFEDVTEEVGLDTEPISSASDEVRNQAGAHSISWGSNACDLNGDGRPELLSSAYARSPNQLWRAVGSDRVEYENISVESGYAYDEGTDWTDNAFARCYCDDNPMAEGCDETPEPQNIDCSQVENLDRRWSHDRDRNNYRLGGNTGTTPCADIDRDGRMDLLTNEIRHWWAGSSSDPTEILYNSEGDDIRFERPGREETGLTREHDSAAWDEGDITSAVFDFDNDARPDLYIGSTDYAGTRGLLFRQTEDGTFEKVPRTDGIDHKSSHGVAVADFDRDGDLDVVAGHSRNRCSTGDHCYPEDEAHVRLFENRVGDEGNWLQLKLVGGEGTNRSAIGARITVETDEWTQTQEVGGGHGHYGMQHDLTRHFGLGEACRAKVTVRWPDASLSTQTFVLKSGHRYRLEQGGDPVVADPE